MSKVYTGVLVNILPCDVRESARDLLESDPRKVRDKLATLALHRVWCLSLQIIAGENAKGISKMNYNTVMEASMGELMGN